MAEVGDDAVAAGMTLVLGSRAAKELDTADNETRDYLANGPARWKPGIVVGIDRGGTAATTVEQAQANLQLQKAKTLSDTVGKIAAYSDTGQIGVNAPLQNEHAANKGYVDQKIAAIPGGSGLADGPTSAAYNRSQTGSGWFAVYMNSALQFMRNTSSRVYKKNIRPWEGSVLGVEPVMFDRREEGTDPDEIGVVAEQVLMVLPEAVLYFDGVVDGVNDRTLLIAAICDIQRLEARIAALEGAQQKPS